jgi:predicted Fe-Mo cluster-binding NifX family protein
VAKAKLESDDLKLKFAVATQGSKGLRGRVSDVFGRTRTFTIVEVEDGRIKGAKVINNPAASLEYGVGPIVAEKLAGEKVDVAIAGEFGPGALALLKAKNIRAVKVKVGTNVCQAVDNVIKELMPK